MVQGGRLPDGLGVPEWWVLFTTEREASVSEVSTIGLDLAKRVFQAHGADASGKVVFRKRLRREQVLTFFAGQPACVVAMEA